MREASRQPQVFASADELPVVPDLPLRLRETVLRPRKSAGALARGERQQRAAGLEEPDRAAVLARRLELQLELLLEREGLRLRLLRRSYSGACLLPVRCRSGRCEHEKHAQANDEGFQSRTS